MQIFYHRVLQELDCPMPLRVFSKEYEYYHLQIIVSSFEHPQKVWLFLKL